MEANIYCQSLYSISFDPARFAVHVLGHYNSLLSTKIFIDWCNPDQQLQVGKHYYKQIEKFNDSLTFHSLKYDFESWYTTLTYCLFVVMLKLEQVRMYNVYHGPSFMSDFIMHPYYYDVIGDFNLLPSQSQNRKIV